VRSYRQGARERTREAIARVLNGVTAAHDASYELDYVDGYASVVNDTDLAAVVREAAGAARVIETDPVMAGEDFSAYLRVAPGCFFFVGAGRARIPAPPPPLRARRARTTRRYRNVRTNGSSLPRGRRTVR
jgi:metal-dependent amidase/aminoacylase/carboxypeptidase family protein